MNKESTNTAFDIAIIGMSGRFPMAKNIHEYWENPLSPPRMNWFISVTSAMIIGSSVRLNKTKVKGWSGKKRMEW